MSKEETHRQWIRSLDKMMRDYDAIPKHPMQQAPQWYQDLRNILIAEGKRDRYGEAILRAREQ